MRGYDAQGPGTRETLKRMGLPPKGAQRKTAKQKGNQHLENKRFRAIARFRAQ
jgi:hypothetical protein